MLDKVKNIVLDTDYSKLIQHWGFPASEKSLDPTGIMPNIKINKVITQETDSSGKAADGRGWLHQSKTVGNGGQETGNTEKKKNGGIMDGFNNFIDGIFGVKKQNTNSGQATGNRQQVAGNDWIVPGTKDKEENSIFNGKLDEQLRQLMTMDEEKYSDKMLTPELRKYLNDIENEYRSSLSDYKTHIAPSYFEVKPSHINVSWAYGKHYYATAYPSYIDFLWTRDVLGFYGKWDISWFVYPADDSAIQWVLKRRATQLKAELSDAMSKWITVDTELEVEYRDVSNIREKLATREERYFQTWFYSSIYHNDLEKLQEEWRKFEQKLAGYWIKIKPAIQRQDEAFASSMPLCLDDLWIYRSMVTSSLGWSFPFISNDLIDNTWILYGINLHTGSLVIFDRFSKKLPNANSVVLATSWAWKSFTMKLEILRYLLLGIDVIVIDPENEYKWLCDKVGGTYINISANSSQVINPFDLPPKIEDVEYGKWDLLRVQIMNLIWMISVLVGGLWPTEESLLDKALQSVYSLKDITFDLDNYEGREVPIMEDLLVVLEGMEWGNLLAIKLSKYVSWTFGKLFNSKTNVNLDTGLTVFSIRDLEDAFKTAWMFNILNFIWTTVRSRKRKRLLIVDEAWIMMQNDTSAEFLFGLIKRARKYGLGVTTITQDVEDFVKSKFGKPIVSNSSIQVLLKQSPSSIKSLDTVFGLSEAEKQKLVASNVWEWLLFAGNQHVAIKILASNYEQDFITTDVR